MTEQVCAFPGCASAPRESRARRCAAHATACCVEGCDRKARGTLCTMHRNRQSRHGDVSQARPIAPVTGRIIRGGYVMLRIDGRYWFEHRLVMGEVLGRPLTAEETPHHKNGDRADNRPENLELWSTKQPKGQRIADKLAWAREIIALYGP